MDKVKIIIVEDDKRYSSVLESVIEYENDLECLYVFESAELLLDHLKKCEERIDVILLDIKLPGMSGVEAIPYIKKLNHSKIIMLTQYDNDDNIFNAMSYGANGYLLKSSSLTNILLSIKDLDDGVSPMSPYIATRILQMFQNYTAPRKEYRLTAQEQNVLREVVNGLSKKMIADKLFISFHTVDAHLRKIYHKLNVNTQAGLVAKTLREQLI